MDNSSSNLANSDGQLIQSAAEVYESFFVPALFNSWPTRIMQVIDLKPEYKILDVACGTGILARRLAEKLDDKASIHGMDVNEGMLSVAKSLAPELNWHQGAAENLPFKDNSFDCVVSQFGLMFFQDPVKAIREMLRVTRSHGSLAIAVWDVLQNTQGYALVAELLEQLFGQEIADEIRAPFVFGDKNKLSDLFSLAGIQNSKITTLSGIVQFASLDEWIYTDIKGWTLADKLDHEQYQQFQEQATLRLNQFVGDSGKVEFPTSAHIVHFSKE